MFKFNREKKPPHPDKFIRVPHDEPMDDFIKRKEAFDNRPEWACTYDMAPPGHEYPIWKGDVLVRARREAIDYTKYDTVYVPFVEDDGTIGYKYLWEDVNAITEFIKDLRLPLNGDDLIIFRLKYE